MTTIRRCPLPLRQRLLRAARGALLGAGALAAALATTLAAAQTAGGCGPLENNFGPYDSREYKDAPEKDPKTGASSNLFLVESAHFLETCEAMVYCAAGTPGREFDYTLRAFPNHHRALVAMVKLAARSNTDKAVDARYTVSCYFNRAIRFKPDDIVVRLLFAVYLKDSKRLDAAREQLREAKALAPTNPFSQYNLGMVAVDLEDYATAVEYARKAYSAGMTQPVLKQRLIGARRWTEADEAASQPGAAEAAPAASSAGAASAPASAPSTSGAAASAPGRP
jgi:tetratricopeptide (TPR) repeat protein